MKERKIKALWLASWYPNKEDKICGTFIEKQAIATSEFCDIALIYLSPSDKNTIEYEISKFPFWTLIIYLPKSKLRYFKLFYYINYFFKAYKILIEEWGKPDIIHLNVISLKQIGVLFIKLFTNTRLIISEHSTRYGVSLREKKILKDYLIIKIHFLLARKVIVVTNSIGDELVKLGFIKSYKVIPNIIDDSIFNLKDKFQRNSKVFLHVSSLNSKKGIDDMIRAFRKLLDIRTDFLLTIVGTDKETVEFYRAFAYKLGLTESNITFERMLSSHEVAQRMQQGDYFIMNSYFETFGVVAVEAQRCGLPVISYPTPGLVEVLKPENTTFVDEHSPEAILKAILKSFDIVVDRKAISESISDQYNSKSVGKNIFDTYIECLIDIYNTKIID
jgi:glycosyltransferase involved in cell wall biosynthesis